MALSTRELYLILRAKNETTSALNKMGRDLDKARSSAALMGAEAQKAHLQAEQAAARHAKAEAEFAQRQLESQRAMAQQSVTTEQARQRTIAYAASMLEAQKATQQHQMAVLQQRQALDQNAVAALQNARAHNEVQIAQARSVEGSGAAITALRKQNLELKDQIANTRDTIIARNNDINAQRVQINTTQQQINTANQLAQNNKALLLTAQQQTHSYDEQIRSQRDSISAMRLDIATRQDSIAAVNREIDGIKRSSAEREAHNARLRETGRTLTDVGAASVIAGGAVLAGAFQLTQAAVDYEKATAMTKTQVDDTSVSLKDLGKVGLDVARDFGVSFDSIQEGLFDIFSSTDANLPQATELLRNLAKAAVAGGTDIKTAGATTIGVLNAWKIPIEDVTKVLDTQFRAVKEGRITYEELSRSLGRATPSAIRAGQSFETLSGILAYLTRNGSTAQNAVAAAGRALDLFSNPTVVGRLKEMGINARDASGNFRPLADVVVELQQKLAKLDPARRAEEINALFKGSGNNIQARRFWDLVLASDAGANSFKDMVDRMNKSGGDLEDKYSQMADTLAVRNEKMKNQWKALAVEAGEALFPALEKIINKLSELAAWFERQDEGTKNFLAWATVITGLLLVAAGAVGILGGGLMVLAGIIGVGVGAMGAIVLAVGSFIAVWVLAYNKVEWFHDAVNWWFGHLWGIIKWFFDGWKNVLNDAMPVLKWFGDGWTKVFKDAKETLTGFLDWFKEGWNRAFSEAKPPATNFFSWFADGWKKIFQDAEPQMRWFVDGWGRAFADAKGVLQPFLDWFAAGWKKAFDDAKPPANDFLTWFKNGWTNTFSDAKGPAQDFFTWFVSGWKKTFEDAKVVYNDFDVWFTQGWRNTLTDAKAEYNAFDVWFTQGWAATLTDAKNAAQTFFTWFITGWKNTWNDAQSALTAFFNWFLSGWQKVLTDARSALTSFFNWFTDGWSRIITDVRNALSSFWAWFTGGWSSTLNNARTSIQGFFSAVVTAFNSGVNAIQAAWTRIQNVVREPVKFVVNTVIDDGLLKAYNAVASVFNVQPQNVHVPRMATGGAINGPGGPRDDLVPAMLSSGEHVWTAKEVEKAGGQQAMYNMRKAVLRGRAAFADGGAVSASKQSWMGDGPWDWITGLVGGLNPLAGAVVNDINPASVLNKFIGELGKAGSGAMANVAKEAGKRMVQGVIKWIGEKVGFGSGDAGTGRFTPQPNGWPPHLGNQPPWSPNVQAAANFIRAMNPGMSMGSYVSGYGWSDHFPKAIDNMNNAAIPSQLARGNGIAKWFIEHPGAYGTKYVIWNKRITMGDGWGPYSVPGQGDHSDHVHLSFYKRGGAVAQQVMDSGGLLQPGMTSVMNATGSAERVLSVAQTQAFERLVQHLDAERANQDMGATGLAPVGGYGGGRSSNITLNVYTQEIDPRRHAMMLGMELEKVIG